MNKNIDGNFTVQKDLHVGGKSVVNDNATIKGNLKVEGWLIADKIRGDFVNKGLFQSEQALKESYPNPYKGWWALVQSEQQLKIYCASDGQWGFTGGYFDGINIDINNSIFAKIEDLTQSYTDERIAELVGTAPEMLDTIHELAQAFQKNGDMIESITKNCANNLQEAQSYTDERIAEIDKATFPVFNGIYERDMDYVQNKGAVTEGGKVWFVKNASDHPTTPTIRLENTFVYEDPDGNWFIDWAGSDKFIKFNADGTTSPLQNKMFSCDGVLYEVLITHKQTGSSEWKPEYSLVKLSEKGTPLAYFSHYPYNTIEEAVNAGVELDETSMAPENAFVFYVKGDNRFVAGAGFNPVKIYSNFPTKALYYTTRDGSEKIRRDVVFLNNDKSGYPEYVYDGKTLESVDSLCVQKGLLRLYGPISLSESDFTDGEAPVASDRYFLYDIASKQIVCYSDRGYYRDWTPMNGEEYTPEEANMQTVCMKIAPAGAESDNPLRAIMFLNKDDSANMPVSYQWLTTSLVLANTSGYFTIFPGWNFLTIADSQTAVPLAIPRNFTCMGLYAREVVYKVFLSTDKTRGLTLTLPTFQGEPGILHWDGAPVSSLDAGGIYEITITNRYGVVASNSTTYPHQGFGQIFIVSVKPISKD